MEENANSKGKINENPSKRSFLNKKNIDVLLYISVYLYSCLSSASKFLGRLLTGRILAGFGSPNSANFTLAFILNFLNKLKNTRHHPIRNF